MNSAQVLCRGATTSDAEQVEHAIQDLLRELSGDPHRKIHQFDEIFHLLLRCPQFGGCSVAEHDGEIRGVITYSYQTALRTGGNYVIVQELWVSPAHRGLGIGEKLLQNLIAAHPGAAVEVGLPPDTFYSAEHTKRFYRRVGFTLIGDRMRYAGEAVLSPD